MKVHALVEHMSDVIKANAAKVGLDALNYDKGYKLIKIGVKNKSPFGLPDKGELSRGGISLVGNDDKVWLVFNSLSGWFKTSPVLRCWKADDGGGGYEFETENSFYRLEEL